MLAGGRMGVIMIGDDGLLTSGLSVCERPSTPLGWGAEGVLGCCARSASAEPSCNAVMPAKLPRCVGGVVGGWPRLLLCPPAVAGGMYGLTAGMEGGTDRSGRGSAVRCTRMRPSRAGGMEGRWMCRSTSPDASVTSMCMPPCPCALTLRIGPTTTTFCCRSTCLGLAGAVWGRTGVGGGRGEVGPETGTDWGRGSARLRAALMADSTASMSLSSPASLSARIGACSAAEDGANDFLSEGRGDSLRLVRLGRLIPCCSMRIVSCSLAISASFSRLALSDASQLRTTVCNRRAALSLFASMARYLCRACLPLSHVCRVTTWRYCCR
eukprot:comp20627_c1_seq1/m.26678 comp20627_c1_seq1/g.26678  ORF comp20627_c1_seq1/g.26678 comp20627_c1_seq1/m.26678 type:complete len:325 (+) comp20627_c1_seq1:264-1238(+)